MEISQQNVERDATQFAAIRDLMLEVSAHGDWLTLAEIAGATEFGEASISAQLRHMRKPRFGRYRVEKRRRQPLLPAAPEAAADGARNATRDLAPHALLTVAAHASGARDVAPWEYRVFNPARAASNGIFEATLDDQSAAAADVNLGAAADVLAEEVCDRQTS